MVGETESLVNGCPLPPEARKLVQIDIFLLCLSWGPCDLFLLFALTITTRVLILCELEKSKCIFVFINLPFLLLLISVNIPSFGSLEFDKYVFALFKYVFLRK